MTDLLAQVQGFSKFEAAIITGCFVIIALCYLLGLFGVRGRGPTAP